MCRNVEKTMERLAQRDLEHSTDRPDQAAAFRFNMLESGRPYSRLLRKLERWRSLPIEDRNLISNLPLTVKNIPAYAKIAYEGDELSECCLVLDGFVCEHKHVAAYDETIALHVPGDIADLQALYHRKLRYSLTALGPAIIARIPRTLLLDALNASPRLRHAFELQIVVEGAILRERIVSLHRRDATSRVAQLLCDLTYRLQSVGIAADYTLNIPWTQADLARLTGISIVHTNRVVQRLRRIGAIEWANKRVEIRDWNALTQIAEFSPAYLETTP
jgi:CRP-like cAMP-binding protein